MPASLYQMFYSPSSHYAYGIGPRSLFIVCRLSSSLSAAQLFSSLLSQSRRSGKSFFSCSSFLPPRFLNCSSSSSCKLSLACARRALSSGYSVSSASARSTLVTPAPSSSSSSSSSSTSSSTSSSSTSSSSTSSSCCVPCVVRQFLPLYCRNNTLRRRDRERRHRFASTALFPLRFSSSSSASSSCEHFLSCSSFSSSACAGPEGGNVGSEEKKESPAWGSPLLFDGETERLSAAQQQQKEELIKELTKRLSGPLADEDGNVPTGHDRPTAIEVDGPSHFYANSTRYTAYTKLKHRLLTRMGYRVLHVPYFEWRKMRGSKEREEYMRRKLQEEPTEWLDAEDEKFYNERIQALQRQYESAAAARQKTQSQKTSSSHASSSPSGLPSNFHENGQKPLTSKTDTKSC